MASDAQIAYASAIFAAIGFNTVAATNILQVLDSIQPSGDTAMRDSLVAGIGLILNLNSALAKLNMAENWHFVHIILTDGKDTASTTSLRDTMGIMLQVGTLIPVSRCRTIIIGIDLQEDVQAMGELMALKQCGLENCEIYDVNSVDVSQLFDRIHVSLGIRRQVAVGVVSNGQGGNAIIGLTRDQAVMRVTQQSFAVVFNLDISGSMSGGRWTRVKDSVRKFLQQTPGSDLVAGICFNRNVIPLNKISTASQARPALPPPAYEPRYRDPNSYRGGESQCCCALF